MIGYDSFGRPPRRRHIRAVAAIVRALRLARSSVACLVLRHVVAISAEATTGSQLTSRPSLLPLYSGTRR
jgi:hypothetical protein